MNDKKISRSRVEKEIESIGNVFDMTPLIDQLYLCDEIIEAEFTESTETN
jgi:hypothetical protein